jgi:L-lactate dehydrogenase (cytochrome)
MNTAGLLSIADLERACARRLPSSIHGYVSGGAEDGNTLAANRAAFERWQFVPRALVDVSVRSQRTCLFGKSWAGPIGISPMGAAGLCSFDGKKKLTSIWPC